MPAEFHYFPFDDGPGEDSMENRWEAMMQYMRTTGILIPWDQSSLEPSTGDLAITANGGLSVQSAVGEGWVHGFMFQQQTDYYSITISPNSSGEDRIDLITARLDTDANTIVIHVEEGTPSMSPVAPTPVESDPIWDLPLAEVYVEDSAVTILPDNITDLRVISTQGAGGSSSVTLNSAGGDETLIADSNAPPNLVVKGLTAGTNINLSSDADTVTIQSSISNVCICSNSTAQVLSNGVSGQSVFDTTIYDPNAMRSSFTIVTPSTGLYQISYFILISSNVSSTGAFTVWIQDNAAEVWAASSLIPNASSGSVYLNGSFTITSTEGDWHQLYVANNSGQTITIEAGFPKFSKVQLAATN